MADGNIFISYRRGSDSNAAGRLYDRLEQQFDRANLFFDIDSIPLGVDFAEHIDGEVAKCDVQLVVIGSGWLDEIARLHDPDDFVRIEIEAALKRPDIPVVPVLLERAKMPMAEDLPKNLRPLVRRNAIILEHAHFAQVVDGRLTSELRRVLDRTQAGIEPAARGQGDRRSSVAAAETAPRDPTIAPGSDPKGERATTTPTLRNIALWTTPILALAFWSLFFDDLRTETDPVNDSGLQSDEQTAVGSSGQRLPNWRRTVLFDMAWSGVCFDDYTQGRVFMRTNRDDCLDACRQDETCLTVTVFSDGEGSCILHDRRLEDRPVARANSASCWQASRPPAEGRGVTD